MIIVVQAISASARWLTRRPDRLFTLLFSAVASLVLRTNALGDEPNHTRSVESGKRLTVYEGVDEHGRID